MATFVACLHTPSFTVALSLQHAIQTPRHRRISHKINHPSNCTADMTKVATPTQIMHHHATTPSSLPSRVPARASTPEAPPPDINTQESSRTNSSHEQVCPHTPQPPRPPRSPPTMRRFRSDPHLRDSVRRTTRPPALHGTFSRRKSQDPTLSPLHIPKARPSLAVDVLPGIPPTPDSITRAPRNPPAMPCPECASPRPVVADGQSTTICPSCLTAFKLCEKHSQRRGSVLTSFPPLLTDTSTLSEEDAKDQDAGDVEGEERKRKMSLVETIGRVIGMLRGGGTQKVRSGGVVCVLMERSAPAVALFSRYLF